MSNGIFPAAMPVGRTPVYFFSRNYFPTLTGATERFRRYLPGLAARGVDFYVVTSWIDRSLPEVERMEFETVRRLPVVDGQFVSTETLLLPMMPELLRAAPGTVQVAEVTPKMRQPLAQLRHYGHRIVQVRTIMPTFEPPRLSLRGIKGNIEARLAGAVLDRIAAGSTVMRDAFSLGIKSLNDKFAIIPHGVDLGRFRPVGSKAEKLALRRELGIRQDTIILLSVGSVMERKRTHLIVDAFREFNASEPNSQLVILGENKARDTLSARDDRESFNHYREKVAQSAARCSTGSVVFSGEVKNVEEFYRAADIFLFTSTIEGMPNAVIEAMASGLPCVLTPFKGLPRTEFGSPGEEFILCADNAAAMGEQVIKLVADRDGGLDLGRAARRFAEANLDSTKAVESYANLYHDIPMTSETRTQANN